MRIILVLLFGAALLPPTVRAQHIGSTPASVALTYTTVRANSGPGQCGCFYLNGGSAEFALPIRSSVSLVGELAGNTTSSVNGNAKGLSLLTYTAGPRIAFSIGRLHPFAEALAGGAHGFNSFFPQAASQSASSANSVAVLLGGGFNVQISRHLAVRLVQADYLLTWLPNGSTNQQNNLRLGVGITFRLGHGPS